MLACATRGKKGSEGGGAWMLIPGDPRLKYKLVWHFELAADMVMGGIRDFVNDADGLVFLEREVMGFGVDGYW